MSSNDLFQQISHPVNKRFKLTEEQLKRYETWKIQPGIAHIKLELTDFDHEVRLNDQNRKHLEINARSSSNFNDYHLCFFVIRDGLQKYPCQSECKYSPDLTIYLTQRSADISSHCYMFNTIVDV